MAEPSHTALCRTSHDRLANGFREVKTRNNTKLSWDSSIPSNELFDRTLAAYMIFAHFREIGAIVHELSLFWMVKSCG